MSRRRRHHKKKNKILNRLMKKHGQNLGIQVYADKLEKMNLKELDGVGTVEIVVDKTPIYYNGDWNEYY